MHQGKKKLKTPKNFQQSNSVILIIGVHTGDNKLVITTGHKSFHFNLPKDVDYNLKYKTDFIIQHYELLLELRIKNKIRQLFSKYKHGNNIYKYS